MCIIPTTEVNTDDDGLVRVWFHESVLVHRSVRDPRRGLRSTSMVFHSSSLSTVRDQMGRDSVGESCLP